MLIAFFAPKNHWFLWKRNATRVEKPFTRSLREQLLTLFQTRLTHFAIDLLSSSIFYKCLIQTLFTSKHMHFMHGFIVV